MKKSELDELQVVLNQAMNRDIATLARIREEIGQVQEAKSALKQKAYREFPQTDSLSDLQCYGKWSHWADHKTIAYERDKKALDVKAEDARKVLARSFGKTEAVKHLGEKAQLEELRAHRRKAEQNGQIPDR